MGLQAIPQKLYYPLGEVAEIAGVKPHVLRYWEAEFGLASSQKDEGGERLYSAKDLEKVLTLKRLLLDERHSVATAKKRLKEEAAKPREAPAGDPQTDRKRLLRQVLTEAESLKKMLGRPE